MRYIKFRGKASNMLYNGADILHHKGDWLYGDLIHQDGKCFICEPNKRFPFGTDFMSFSVEPDTVGQFIQRYKTFDLYEGDIVKYDRESWDGEEDDFAEVRRFGLIDVNYNSDYDQSMIQWIEDIDWEVVGNIHDNPELLTKTE